MQADAIRETVISQALESEKHLEIACLLRTHFEEIQKRVISRFLLRLKKQLSGSLGDKWRIKDDLSTNIRKGEFRVSKDTWANRCAIVLSQEGEPRGFYVGWHRYKGFGQPPKGLGQSISQALKAEGYTRGKVEDVASGWGVYSFVDGKYSRWDQSNPEALVEMHFGDSAVNYFADRIRIWVAVVEPIVDRMSPSKKH
jgi:hypothetical protein